MMVGTTFDSATSALATECITQAETKIRERMSDRYDVNTDAWQTSTSTPPIVSTWCKWLSTGYCYENLARGGKDAFTRSDRYINKAMDNMTDVLEFKANVVDSTGSAIPDGSTTMQVLSSTKDYHDTFAEDNPLNWNVDPDKIDDIENDRDI